MVTNVSVRSHTPEETVTTNLTHVNRIDATTEPNAHQAITIKTFRAAAHLDTPDACAIKILMNVHCLRHAEMELLARTSLDHINAYVLRVMKVETVQ